MVQVHHDEGLANRIDPGVTEFAAAEYTAMTDSINTVTGKAGLRVGL
jgi:hypothetical protein